MGKGLTGVPDRKVDDLQIEVSERFFTLMVEDAEAPDGPVGAGGEERKGARRCAGVKRSDSQI